MEHVISTGFRPLRALRNSVRCVGSAVWAGLIVIAEARPQMEKLRKLSELSDDDLAARGLTRAQAVEQIFGNRCL